MTKRNKTPPTWRRLLPAVDSAMVVGLGGVGRQAAVQLAALGVPRLHLVDARTIARTTHATEGYPFEDVGRLRAHATAHMCHKINPQLEIHAIPKRPLTGVDAGDAVFCCPGTPGIRRSLRQSLRPNVVVARCNVVGYKLRLDFARGVSVVAGRLGWRAASVADKRSARRPAVPIYFATVAAGLLVAQFIRFCEGQLSWRSVRLDLQTLHFNVEQPG